jgi:hypothetical protein
LENDVGDKEGGVEEKEVGVGRKKGWSLEYGGSGHKVRCGRIPVYLLQEREGRGDRGEGSG